MKEQVINGVTVEYYDAIDELPIVRHHRFNEFIMVDSKIGSTMDDVDLNLSKLIQMVEKGEKEDAKQQIYNLRQNLQFAIENVSPKSMAFAVLVRKIDGQEVNDITDLGLNKVVKKLSEIGLSWKIVKFIIDQVKKKLRRRWQPTSQKRTKAGL